jgi:hypothetical protein
MGLGFGTGFLATDPRSKKNPKGGSIHAAQDVDTTVMNTGNMNDSMGIGYASNRASAGTGMFAKPYVAPKPDYAKTAAETVAQREEQGIASSHQNMGSLAVDFRKSEQALKSAGKQTVTEGRAAKILDTRAAAEHRRLVTDPAQREATKFRNQAAAAKAYMDKWTAGAKASLANAKSGGQRALDRAHRQFSRAEGRGRKLSSTASKGLGLKSKQSGFLSVTGGPDHSKQTDQLSKDFKTIREEGDPMALAEQREHAAAPYTQALDWKDMANAQSASGRASPAQMAQAAASQGYRQNPNK